MWKYLVFTWGVFVLLAILVPGSVALAQNTSLGPDIRMEVVKETDGIPAGDTGRFALLVSIPEGWHINAHKPREDYLIPTDLDISSQEGFSVSARVYPEPVDHFLEGTTTPLLVYGGEVPVFFAIKVEPTVTPGDYVLSGKFTYQACNDTQCWMPVTQTVSIPIRVLPAGTPTVPAHPEMFGRITERLSFAEEHTPQSGNASRETGALTWDEVKWKELSSRFEVTGRNSGYLNASKFLEWLDGVESGRASADLNRFAGMNPWLIALLTLLGGLALNLTPCVLPLIPVNLAIIGAGAKATSRFRGFLLGAVYGSAMAFVYGVLGILAALLGTAFGTINASPWFNLAVAIIFLVMAIAMFDWINIDFSKYRSGVSIEKKPGGSFIAAFALGGLAALLAGACVGPVVISVILLSQDLYAKGVYVGLGLPFLLGIGMALPWPLAGAGIALLPKPGGWMVRVKQILGVLILVLAIYYGFEGVRLLNDRYFLDQDSVKHEVESTVDSAGWSHNLLTALEEAQKTKKPVFIDFWATWCKNCLTMNQTTFRDPDVMQRLDSYVKVKFQAQQLDQSPAKEVMEQLGVGGFGLPVYVILKPTP